MRRKSELFIERPTTGYFKIRRGLMTPDGSMRPRSGCIKMHRKYFGEDPEKNPLYRKLDAFVVFMLLKEWACTVDEAYPMVFRVLRGETRVTLKIGDVWFTVSEIGCTGFSEKRIRAAVRHLETENIIVCKMRDVGGGGFIYSIPEVIEDEKLTD